jgi:hypothetical protein
MFPTCKNGQKQVKNQELTDKNLLFDGLIQENIGLSDLFSFKGLAQKYVVKIKLSN